MGDRAVPIVAKIETKPAVEHIEKILRVTDVVMVARGDLGVELPMEEIPLLQKDLLRAARAASRPAIVATQMLESMIRAPRPTRAEATDVANAVLDGADGIMLSGETAIGRFPFEAAAAAARIAEAVESRGRRVPGGATGVPPRRRRDRRSRTRRPRSRSRIATSWPSRATRRPVARRACCPRSVRAVRCTRSSPDEDVRRANAVLWGVTPLPAAQAGRHRRDDRADGRGTAGVRAREAPGDAVVMAAASPAGKTTTNMLKIHRVGSPVR